MGKKQSSTNTARNIDYFHVEEWKSGSRYLHVRSGTMKSLQKNHMEMLSDIGLGKDFLDKTATAQETNEKQTNV